MTMSLSSGHVFDRTLHKSNVWLADTMGELGTRDPHVALAVLRAGLHILRDHLPVPVAAELSAQLPMLIRGLFFESWRPAEAAPRVRDVNDFYDEMECRLARRDLSGPLAFDALVRVLQIHLTPGLFRQIEHVLPRGIRRAWGAANMA